MQGSEGRKTYVPWLHILVVRSWSHIDYRWWRSWWYEENAPLSCHVSMPQLRRFSTCSCKLKPPTLFCWYVNLSLFLVRMSYQRIASKMLLRYRHRYAFFTPHDVVTLTDSVLCRTPLWKRLDVQGLVHTDIDVAARVVIALRLAICEDRDVEFFLIYLYFTFSVLSV